MLYTNKKNAYRNYLYNTLKYHIELIAIDNFMIFKRQIKNFRKFLEKVALRTS